MSKDFVENNKQDRKKRIIEASIQLITRDGFSKMNLDQVVNLAGTSKSAIYEIFKNKEGLLKAVCDATTFDSKQLFSEAESIDLPVETYLKKFVDMYVELCHQTEYIAVIRSVFSELGNSPNIGKYFFENGPKRTVDELEQYLAFKVSKGELIEMDCAAVSQQMIGALVWYQQSTILCITDEIPDISLMKKHAQLLFDSFITRYKTKT